MNAEASKLGSPGKPSLVMKFAAKYNIQPETLLNTLKSTCFRVPEGEVTNEQMVALLVVADQYGLNPFTKEIYAYPDKHKGIVPVVSIDGWVRIINEHPDYDGYDVILPPTMMGKKEGEHPPCWPWITIQLHRKNVSHTPALTEYFDECYKPPYKPRGKDYFIDGPWQSHPKRFLRHKALIQAARVVFGFAGIYDDDEAQRIIASDATVVSTQPAKSTDVAKENLKRQLEQTQGQRIEPIVGAQPSEELQKSVTDTVKAAQAVAALYRFGTAEALAHLRAAKTLADLKKAFREVEDDYEFSGREMPIDVEAIYRDIKEGLEQKEAT